MVTATNGTATFKNTQGVSRTVNIYISDVTKAYCTISTTGKAGTGDLTFWNAPEDFFLTDISITTGPTVITNIQVVRDGYPINVLQLTNQLDTLNNRPQLAVPFRKGAQIAFIQV